VNRDAVDAITTNQLGLATTRQFMETGGTPASLKWAVRDGWLRPYRWPRLYQVVGAADAEFRPLLGACLAGGDHVAAAGLGAAWVHGAPDVASGALEVVGFAGKQLRIHGVRTRSTLVAPDGLVEWRQSLPVVVPELCVVQLAADRRFLAERTANDFVKRRLTTFRRILTCLDTVSPHGRGAGALRAFCEDELAIVGHDDSPAARKLGRMLQAAGLAPFETQFRVATPWGDYFLDFAWAWAKVGLEYQGRHDHALTFNEIDADARRRARLVALGWRILDVSAGTRDEAIEWVESALRAVYAAQNAESRVWATRGRRRGR
jgi:very-short-patch-repair endonuclease